MSIARWDIKYVWMNKWRELRRGKRNVVKDESAGLGSVMVASYLPATLLDAESGKQPGLGYMVEL